MGKKIAFSLGIIGLVFLILGFIGSLFHETEISKLSLKQIVNKIENQERFQYIKNEIGVTVKETENNISFIKDGYSFIINYENEILSGTITHTLDTLLFSLIYDTLGQFYEYQEGDLYASISNNPFYTLAKDGIYYDQTRFQIDISKKPIFIKKTNLDEWKQSTNLVLDEFKDQEQSKLNQLIQSFIDKANLYNTNQQLETGALLVNQAVLLEVLSFDKPTNCSTLAFDATGLITFENCLFNNIGYNYTNGEITLYQKTEDNSIGKRLAETTVNSYIDALRMAQNQYYLAAMNYPTSLEELVGKVGEIKMNGEIPQNCIVTFNNGDIILSNCSVFVYNKTRICNYDKIASCQ